MDITLIVGNAATIATIINNFAGLPICFDIFKNRSTKNVSILPFVSGILSNNLWLQYGLLVNDPVIILVNSIAFTLQTVYTGCYYMYAVQRKRIQNLLFGVFALIFSIYVYAFHLVEDTDLALKATGIAACLSNVITYGSPLESMKEVFKDKCTETLPFPIILANFIASSLWVLYGMLVYDYFIKVPNIIGAILSGFQLSLFAVFKSVPSH